MARNPQLQASGASRALVSSARQSLIPLDSRWRPQLRSRDCASCAGRGSAGLHLVAAGFRACQNGGPGLASEPCGQGTTGPPGRRACGNSGGGAQNAERSACDLELVLSVRLRLDHAAEFEAAGKLPQPRRMIPCALGISRIGSGRGASRWVIDMIQCLGADREGRREHHSPGASRARPRACVLQRGCAPAPELAQGEIILNVADERYAWQNGSTTRSGSIEKRSKAQARSARLPVRWISPACAATWRS